MIEVSGPWIDPQRLGSACGGMHGAPHANRNEQVGVAMENKDGRAHAHDVTHRFVTVA